MIGTETISGLRVHVVQIPARATHSHGIGDVSVVRTVLLELTTAGGLTGWGEASPWPAFSGTAEATVGALHGHLRPVLIGADPMRIEQIMARADATVVGCPEAKAAVETALLDIAGKMAGLPVAELLGGRCRDVIPLSFSVANPDFDADLETIAALWADGVRLFKMKTGFAEHRFDLMRLETLRGLYGDAIDLRIDYNQGMKPYEAVRRVRDLEVFRPTFIEQPVPRADLAAMAEIARVLDTPLLADESVFNAREALIGAQMRIADLFSLKIMKSGGLRRALEVAAVARAAGIGVYGGCMFETGVAHLAGTHLMAAVPDLTLGCEFYMSTYYLQEDVLAEAFPVRNGMVAVPTGPGLGGEPDPERLGRWTVEAWG
ncbi:MAG TPA: enolase C-terminal domain-like protein [Rhodopila sp.]|uniref:enolase C-terminal domain-like protein n=1 Tax=Rhodopila sp. TaxID=2480087 RepID=UPI002BE2F918|nr:enolase C-terminal domain-like protein [Rhodopila sp.]HVY15285.1 enolase C-terminal domain-like protein [Rhodopila sp.]